MTLTRQGNGIVVIGANGRVGQHVVRVLVNDGIRPRLLVRNTDTATELFGDKVDLVAADLSDPAAVDAAMSGATAAFLCSPVHPDQVRLQGHVVTAAAREGTYLVKLSGLGTFADSFVDSGRMHAETEAAIRDAGIRHAFLHPYFFTQNLGFQMEGARKNGFISSAVPDAAIAMVDAQDIGEVAAQLLLDPDRVPGGTLPLTCNVAVTYAEIATMMAAALHRPVECRATDMDTLKDSLTRSGQPDWHVRLVLQFNDAFNQGMASEVSPWVRDILGREPISVEASLQAMLGNTASGSNPFPS